LKYENKRGNTKIMKNYEANPFNPQFGKRPKQFIGRELIINNFLQGMSDKNDPNRTSIITGIRGTGKTAILSDVHESLDPDKHAVINITARDGMLLEILDEFVRSSKGKSWAAKSFDKVKGFSVGAMGFSFGITRDDETKPHSFRFMLTELLDKARDKGI